ncbi:MAG: DUF1501 domain-containing protein [Rubripirellula sp.]|nr:DUF1501 domain-containing protein [Rubripirellula sp.]
MGSWISYGLGTANANLPSVVTVCPGVYPIKESQNWQNAFLAGKYQTTCINTNGQRVEQLIDHIRNNDISSSDQRQQLDLLQQWNRHHAKARADDQRLESRLE